jgi:hypothetical protein
MVPPRSARTLHGGWNVWKIAKGHAYRIGLPDAIADAGRLAPEHLIVPDWSSPAARAIRDQLRKRHGTDDDPLLTHVELAKRYDLDREKTRKRLDRWRSVNKGGGWIEATDTRRNEPKYLYRLSAVEHLFK